MAGISVRYARRLEQARENHRRLVVRRPNSEKRHNCSDIPGYDRFEPADSHHRKAVGYFAGAFAGSRTTAIDGAAHKCCVDDAVVGVSVSAGSKTHDSRRLSISRRFGGHRRGQHYASKSELSMVGSSLDVRIAGTDNLGGRR